MYYWHFKCARNNDQVYNKKIKMYSLKATCITKDFQKCLILHASEACMIAIFCHCTFKLQWRIGIIQRNCNCSSLTVCFRVSIWQIVIDGEPSSQVSQVLQELPLSQRPMLACGRMDVIFCKQNRKWMITGLLWERVRLYIFDNQPRVLLI